MLTLDRTRCHVADLPGMVKIGVGGLGFSGLGDVIAHLGASDHVGDLYVHTSAESVAHLAGFVSMVVIFLGVVLDGVRQGRARQMAVPADKEQHDAVR
jgi:hypothetical protein